MIRSGNVTGQPGRGITGYRTCRYCPASIPIETGVPKTHICPECQVARTKWEADGSKGKFTGQSRPAIPVPVVINISTKEDGLVEVKFDARPEGGRLIFTRLKQAAKLDQLINSDFPLEITIKVKT